MDAVKAKISKNAIILYQIRQKNFSYKKVFRAKYIYNEKQVFVPFHKLMTRKLIYNTFNWFE